MIIMTLTLEYQMIGIKEYAVRSLKETSFDIMYHNVL